jgi:hypothetical protein
MKCAIREASGGREWSWPVMLKRAEERAVR